VSVQRGCSDAQASGIDNKDAASLPRLGRGPPFILSIHPLPPRPPGGARRPRAAAALLPILVDCHKQWAACVRIRGWKI